VVADLRRMCTSCSKAIAGPTGLEKSRIVKNSFGSELFSHDVSASMFQSTVSLTAGSSLSVVILLCHQRTGSLHDAALSMFSTRRDYPRIKWAGLMLV
jgi:hypothetical protein